ncbi:hypothetical protein VTN96DRAFT_9567 [Rasamsonia emersonii]
MANPSCLRAAARNLSSSLFRNSTSRSARFVRHHSSSPASSVSADELSHFSGLASSWWDPMGPSRVLHLMNPLRHDFIAECLAESSPAPPRQLSPEKQNGSEASSEGLRYLDVGCGGGIFAESLARTIPLSRSSSSSVSPTNAASILAIDPSSTLIKIARDHARMDPAIFEHMRSGRFRYENTTVEALSEQSTEDTSSASSSSSPAAAADRTFDVITLFEVIEHVDPKTSPLTFLKHCLRLLRPGGWLIGSTIARTVPSYVVNKVVAEAPWPIGVVPRGTHEWSKFVNADELRGWVEEALMRAKDGTARRAGSEALQGMKWKCAGVVYIPGWGWKMVKGGEDWGNYFWAVRKGV